MGTLQMVFLKEVAGLDVESRWTASIVQPPQLVPK